MTKRRPPEKPTERPVWKCQFCGAEGPSFYWRKRHICPRSGPNIIRSK